MGLAARRSVLQELGYEVETCANGESALAALAAREFRLLITDYKLPDITGQILIGKARKKHTELRVILLSGYADALGLHENNTGADIVIQKSANEVTTLVRAVRKLLQPSRQNAKGIAGGPKKPAGPRKPVTDKPAAEKKPMTRITPPSDRAKRHKR